MLVESLSIENSLPPTKPFIIKSGVDRYGFSHVLARYCNYIVTPRSFANWIHGWIYEDDPTVEDLMCSGLPRDVRVIVRNERERLALIGDGFRDVIVGGLPFGYVKQQHRNRINNSLIAYPPHSTEAERMVTSQVEYLDYLESLKADFDSVFVSIGFHDLGSEMHRAATSRGIHVVQGARPDDANSLLRVRAILDSFEYVTSNVFGSHVLYALFAESAFSFCGPIFSLYAPELLHNASCEHWSRNYIEKQLWVLSKSFLVAKFSRFLCSHPSLGVKDKVFADDQIGFFNQLTPSQVVRNLGWSPLGQVSGYANGARRRLLRSLNLDNK